MDRTATMRATVPRRYDNSGTSWCGRSCPGALAAAPLRLDARTLCRSGAHVRRPWRRVARGWRHCRSAVPTPLAPRPAKVDALPPRRPGTARPLHCRAQAPQGPGTAAPRHPRPCRRGIRGFPVLSHPGVRWAPCRSGTRGPGCSGRQPPRRPGTARCKGPGPRRSAARTTRPSQPPAPVPDALPPTSWHFVAPGRSRAAGGAPQGYAVGWGQLASRCCPGPRAFSPMLWSSAHIVAWFAVTTGLPSSRSSGAITS